MSKIKPEQFVRVWLEAAENNDSKSWIANILQVSDQTVSKLAGNLRRNGVDLPKLRKPFIETIKVDALNKLIRQKFGG